MSLAATDIGREEHLLPDRKHRLLACGLCRQVADAMDRPELFSVLETCEAFADGLATPSELSRARHFALQVARNYAELPDQEKYATAVALAAAVASPSSRNLYKTVAPGTVGQIGKALDAVLGLLAADGAVLPAVAGYAALFDDIVPRATRFAAEWRTDTAVALARHMYEAREFSAMPILADALQDAGCDNDDILNHCRGELKGVAPGTRATHVRGCWVVDLVLGHETSQSQHC